MAELRKYGAAAILDGIPLITRGALDFKANPTLAAGDVTIDKDGAGFNAIEGGGTFGNFVAVVPAGGTSVQLKPDSSALTCKCLTIKLVDQTNPKEWEDQLIRVETYGHASAMHPFDLGTAALTSDNIRDAVVDDATRIDASALNTLSGHDPGAALVKVADLGVVQTGDSYAEVTDGTYGLSALNTLLGTIAGYVDTEITTIINRIGAFTGTGVNTILGFFKAIMGKAASAPSDLGALTFDPATDSLEAIEDVGIAGLQGSLNLVAPITHTPDSVVLTTGTLISGTVANMQSDDNSPYITAPAAGGLLEDLTFNIGLGHAPISVGINGYFNGAGQYADVWAKDAVLNVWDKLTNSSTRMATRASDANYTYPLSHEHIDPATGDVVIRFTSPSVNGAHRLNLDRVLVATVTDVGAGATLTAAEIWANPERTLTSDTGEPLDTAALVTAITNSLLLRALE